MPIAPPQTSGNNPQTLGRMIRARYGPKAQQAYLKLVAAHPEATPLQVAKAFILSVSIKGLAQAIKDAESGTAAAIGQASSSGFGTTALGGGGGSDWAHLFVRLAEFGVGALLVALGIQAILRRTQTGQQIQGAVIGIAGATPPGRAVRTEVAARQRVRQTAQESATYRRASRIRNERLARQQ